MTTKRAASSGTQAPECATNDDNRSFKVQQATGATSRVKLRRQNVIGWGPNANDMTGVVTQDGKSFRVHCRFAEFHAWVIAPYLEQDKRSKEAAASAREEKASPKTVTKKSAPRKRAVTRS